MIKGAIESRIGNPNVSWETALKQNYGIDVNFLNNRLKVSADIFFEDRKDILIKKTDYSYHYQSDQATTCR